MSTDAHNLQNVSTNFPWLIKYLDFKNPEPENTQKTDEELLLWNSLSCDELLRCAKEPYIWAKEPCIFEKEPYACCGSGELLLWNSLKCDVSLWCAEKPSIFASEPYVYANELYTSAKEFYVSAKETYVSTQEPYAYAKEPCMFAKEPYLSVKESYIFAKELFVSCCFKAHWVLKVFWCVAGIFMCAMTYSYLKRASFVCATWLVPICDIAQMQVPRDSFLCEMSLVRMCVPCCPGMKTSHSGWPPTVWKSKSMVLIFWVNCRLPGEQILKLAFRPSVRPTRVQIFHSWTDSFIRDTFVWGGYD